MAECKWAGYRPGGHNRHSRVSEMIEVLRNYDLRLGGYDDRLVRMAVERIQVLGKDKVQVQFEFGVKYESQLVAD